MNKIEGSGYPWRSAALTPSHSYLLPTLPNEMAGQFTKWRGVGCVLDLGCGNASVANSIKEQGWVKFCSIKTLRELLREAGFLNFRFELVGRIPSLAKSIIAVAREP